MPLRRRPLLRAAAIGGGAYLAGKNRGQRQTQQGSDGASSQQGQAKQGQAQPGQAGATQGGKPAGSSTTDQLSRLTALHREGQLTDAEFAAAKSKLLGI